ncbi:hypothetical protein GBAR_LOCUS8653, partial [Geodia barretti]
MSDEKESSPPSEHPTSKDPVEASLVANSRCSLVPVSPHFSGSSSVGSTPPSSSDPKSTSL